jgi:ribose transport system substrate-binding protein
MISSLPRPRRYLRLASVSASAMVAGIALAACSSSGGGGSTSASGTSSASAGADSATVSSAASLATAAEATPSSIYQKTPLKATPDKNHLLVYINSGVSGGVEINDGMRAAAQALGWGFKSLSFTNANPTSLITAMQQALQLHATAVSFSGDPETVWGSQVSAYQKAHAFIIPVAVGPGVQINQTVPANIGDFTDAGKAMGNWLISKSGGKASALEVGIPALPVLTTSLTGMNEVLKAKCPSCQTTTLNATLNQINSNALVPAIVSNLREHPSTKYVISAYQPFTAGLTNAMKAAGLNDITYAGAQPDPSDLAAIKSGGSEAMAAIQNNVLLGWMVADSAARAVEGMTIPAGDGGAPSQLLVKSNIKSTSLDGYALPPNYQQEFKTLWKISG